MSSRASYPRLARVEAGNDNDQNCGAKSFVYAVVIRSYNDAGPVKVYGVNFCEKKCRGAPASPRPTLEYKLGLRPIDRVPQGGSTGLKAFQ